MSIKLSVFILLMFFALKQVNSQICFKNNWVKIMVPITSAIKYPTKYTLEDGIKRTKWQTAIKTRLISVNQLNVTRHCCPGYIRIDNSTDDRAIICKPICNPTCKHGRCMAPNECTCDYGYILDFEDSNTCKPVCNACHNGVCHAPNICKCNPGYVLINGTCHPACLECQDGKCITPENCECDVLCDYNDNSDEHTTGSTTEDDYTSASLNENDLHIEVSTALAENEYTSTNSNETTSNGTEVENITQIEAEEKTWLQQHWVPVFVPLILIILLVIAGVLTCFVWRSYVSRSYTVQDYSRCDDHTPRQYEDIDISKDIASG